ncbi:hypothetical protein CCR75_001080 [Bremia lactucae]|uniref:TIR domain-containing protein n=1 Tax=Bremia lactucae TaxID=4779 RepID=A0A976FRH6_BRELC|nr:hypothetical protein CCR75_001080 [Bremia lactucae]
MDPKTHLTIHTDDHAEPQPSRNSETQYIKIETPIQEYSCSATFHPDTPRGRRSPYCRSQTAETSDTEVQHSIHSTSKHGSLEHNLPLRLRKNTDADQSSKGDTTEHTTRMSSIEFRGVSKLPKRYLTGQFQSNSYFARKLLRLSHFIVLGDLIALGFFYFYKFEDEIGSRESTLYIGSPLTVLFSSTAPNCSKSLALAALVYHLFPAVLILGLPASGWRLFEPFRREERIDEGGRLQKVKRTICLQICELVSVGMFVYEALVFGFFIYYVASGKLFQACDFNALAFLFCSGAVVMFYLLFVLMRAFARFREHIKMQLGAFKESDQTGDVKAHMLRAKMKRKKKHHEKRGSSLESTRSKMARSTIITDVRKRLFRGAQLGDLKLLRRSIRMAKTHLGDAFAYELYSDPVMVFGIFGLATKNPMHVAAYQGNIAAMELLVHAHFQVNALDKVSRVRFSTGDLFWYLASFLIPKPVVPADELCCSVFKTTLVTPLHCAVSTGRLAAVQWLIAHGANVNLCSKSSHRCESRLPPLFVADHPDIVHELLRARANHLAIPDPGHMNTITVLQLAYLRGNYAVAQVLEDWGGDVALTPLHAAAAMNNVALIRTLLRKNVHPDVLGELGYVGLNKRTPLHWAAVTGAVEALEILLAAKANANFQDAHGRTALHWAARVNRVDSVHVLLAHGADPTIVDASDMTPILCAACAGGTSVEMFKALVESGGDINHHVGLTGDTALHFAVKRDDQETALALLSMGGDIMRTNGKGFRPIDCTTSTRLQFEIKRAAGTRDVMISYTHSHLEFALKVRKSLEEAHITVWLDLMDPSGIGGGSVWREEIARGITNAAVVLCILTEDYALSEWCLKELALAKQVGTPILAISTEQASISEEVQVYLYTRQLVPFESAIVRINHVDANNVVYEYDEDAYRTQLRMLLDGMRDEIEKRKEESIQRNIRRAETKPLTCSNPGAKGNPSRRLHCGMSGISTYGMDSMRFDEHMLTGSAYDTMNDHLSDSHSSFVHEYDEELMMPSMLYHHHHRQKASRSMGLQGVLSAGKQRHFDHVKTNGSIESSASSSVDDTGVSDSIVLDTGGYYFYRAMNKDVAKRGGRRDRIVEIDSTSLDTRGGNESIVETLDDLNKATASGEEFVFICHGDYHQRFVQKLCAQLCREGGLRCYVDRKPLKETSFGTEDHEEAHERKKSTIPMKEDLSVRIHQAKEAVLKCSVFVILLSEKTLASELVKDQLAFAEDKGKKILPIVVNRMELSLEVKYSLARSEFFHFFTKGDMMGFRQSLRHLLDALREEVSSLRIKARPPKESQVYGRFGEVRPSAMSARHSFYPLYPTERSVRRHVGHSSSIYASSHSDIANFGVPPLRLSQTFAVTSGRTRNKALDLSLSHSMIGNFSTFGRITDEFDEDDERLTYGGLEDEDFDTDEEIDVYGTNKVDVVHEEALRVAQAKHKQLKRGALSSDSTHSTHQGASDSSITILELTGSSDSINISFDVMPNENVFIKR